MFTEKENIIKNQVLLEELKSLLFNYQIKLVDKIILDVGCADIRSYSKYLSRKSKKYIGIDNDPQEIEKGKARLKNKKSRLIVQSAEKLKFENNYFDIIIINDSLAYTNKNKVLDEALRVLKSNGMIISLFNNDISYYLYKIFHPRKSWIIEILHSILVIINTIIYRIFHFKIFKTTFNTVHELNTLLKDRNVRFKKVWLHKKNIMPHSLIIFIVIK